ncbi:unnamed protein product [Amaranthus hypochondriacus]
MAKSSSMAAENDHIEMEDEGSECLNGKLTVLEMENEGEDLEQDEDLEGKTDFVKKMKVEGEMKDENRRLREKGRLSVSGSNDEEVAWTIPKTRITYNRANSKT